MKNRWKIIGYFATVIIVLSFPGYYFKMIYFDDYGSEAKEIGRPEFVGSKACLECHKTEYDDWLISDHYFAMDTADEKSVLGDFDDATLEQDGKTHKFYRKGGDFFVFTDGPSGKMEEFKVDYTFGAWPLQQYLVAFPDGKYQTLALTWDTITKSWYHMADAVYAGQDIDHTNWLHWTNQAQNWNGMCADCHSTNLVKGFDHKTKNYNTTWSEISVGCEACHGPSSEHLKWAQLPAMSRPQNTNTGLLVQTAEIDNKRYVDLCARCHARRGSMSDFNHDMVNVMDHILPSLPIEPNYYPDGQILEEDYVYGSFIQSKMYMNDVKCNDCHNVHSGKLIMEKQQLCLQCHRVDIYDTPDHHFHKMPGEPGKQVVSEFGDVYKSGDGASCINCHMPGRYYMGVDYRRDHSFRIPRPDLSEELGTPNACTYCHADQTNAWAAAYTEKWYGKSIRSNYGALVAGYVAEGQSGNEKIPEILTNELFPPHIKSMAIASLAAGNPVASSQLASVYLSDVEPSIRHSAVTYFNPASESDVLLLMPLLSDPVKAVRIETASKLMGIPETEIPEAARIPLKQAMDEYRATMEYSADFAASRHNLGNYYSAFNQPQQAIENYTEAIRIDDQFYPAKINLAMIYNGQGENEKAELLLKDVIKNHPDVEGTAYSLGLLLAEMGNYEESLKYLEQAAQEQPDNPRVFMNLGMLYDFYEETSKATAALDQAIELDPENPELFIRIIEFHIKHENFARAKELALTYQKLNPTDASVNDLLKFLDEKLQ